MSESTKEVITIPITAELRALVEEVRGYAKLACDGCADCTNNHEAVKRLAQMLVEAHP